MWEMAYKTRAEYMAALTEATRGKNITGAEALLTDIKNYFFKRNLQSIGDTEIIASLPSPEELAAQYEGKDYTNPRALKKAGKPGFFKRLGIFLLTFFAVILGVVFTVGFLALLLAGLASIACGALLTALHVAGSLPGALADVVAMLPGILTRGDNLVALVFLFAAGIFAVLLAGTALKALRRLKKKYHTWTLKKISGCYRLPVTLDDVYSKAWRVSVYIFLPLSMIAALISAGMLVLGVGFTF